MSSPIPNRIGQGAYIVPISTKFLRTSIFLTCGGGGGGQVVTVIDFY